MNPRTPWFTAGGFLSLMLSLAIGAGIVAAGRAQEEGGEAGGSAEKRPEFKDAASPMEFDQAVELFKKKDYKEAQAKFKKVKSRGKAAEDRKLIERWEAGCFGGLHIELFRKQAAESQTPEKILFQAQDLLERYVDTPAEVAYRVFLDELSGKVIHTLEDFESPSNEYSEKFGKEFITDPAKAAHGRGCLRWVQTPDRKAVQLQVGRVPKSWSSYSGVVFWIYYDQKVEIEVVIRCPGKAKEQVNSLMVKHVPQTSGRWERVHYDFEKFQKYGQGSISSVDSFILQVPGKRDFKVMVDWIGLVRKGSQTASTKGKK